MIKVFSEGLKYAPKLNAHISYNKDTKEGEIRTIENINVNMKYSGFSQKERGRFCGGFPAGGCDSLCPPRRHALCG